MACPLNSGVFAVNSEAPRKHPVAWITGASQGIGRALAIELASRGYRVAISARNENKLQKLASVSRNFPIGGEMQAFPLDVTDASAVIATLDRIEQEMGAVDIAVLNAGTHKPTPLNEFNAEDVAALFDLNVMGSVKVLDPLLKRFLPRARGHIAVVASLAGYRGLPMAAGYGASKAALHNLCESLSIELRGTGVKLQVVNPGFVKTPLTDLNEFPMPSLIGAEQAAEIIADGLASERYEIRFPSVFEGVMGLLKHFPHSLYSWIIGKQTGYGAKARG